MWLWNMPLWAYGVTASHRYVLSGDSKDMLS